MMMMIMIIFLLESIFEANHIEYGKFLLSISMNDLMISIEEQNRDRSGMHKQQVVVIHIILHDQDIHSHRI
jgi:hypothetical protein